MIVGEPDQTGTDLEMVGEKLGGLPALIDGRTLVLPHRDPDAWSRRVVEGNLEPRSIRCFEQESSLVQPHGDSCQTRVSALAQKTTIITDHHPPPVVLEARGADCGFFDFNPTAGLDRIKPEAADDDHDQPSLPAYRSTAPAEVVRAG